MPDILNNKRLLLIIGGGIAAYKCLDLIRRLGERGVQVRCILTKGGAEFVTPLSVSSLSGEKVYQDLFSLTDEAEMGHIRLSREADLVLVAPATADMMAKMVAGIADNLATTALLATDKPVMIAPAMNTQMWDHPATQRNLKTLQEDGIAVIPPGSGDLACGEVGAGRLAEVPDMVAAIEAFFQDQRQKSALNGKHIVITAGPTHEAIDPVRYIANRSSGKQGYAIASALADKGAHVSLISGPTHLERPAGVDFIPIESATEMLAATEANLPADVVICVAAVADWRVKSEADQKLKKQDGGLPDLELVENPDILKTISNLSDQRPELVIGFAAETEKLLDNATAKLARKGCDWIMANDVSTMDGQSVMGGDHNHLYLVHKDGHEEWSAMSKQETAQQLATRIEQHFSKS